MPEVPRNVPAGKHIVGSVDEVSLLTNDEEQGIAQALTSLRAGRRHTAEQVRQRIESLLRK
jgi:hypothetical protein